MRRERPKRGRVLLLQMPAFCRSVCRGVNLRSIHSKSWWPWWPDSANFFHFPPKFRLRTWKPSRLNCTNASPSVCRLCFVFNIPTSYIDLLYFDNLLLKTPDLCNLPTFVAIFLLQFTHFFRQFLEAKKTDSANLSAFRMYALKGWECGYGGRGWEWKRGRLISNCDRAIPNHSFPSGFLQSRNLNLHALVWEVLLRSSSY